MRLLPRLLLIAVVVVVASDCQAFSVSEPVVRIVLVKDNVFDPVVINTVPAPTTVRWEWAPGNTYDHNVVFDSFQVAQAGGWLVNSPTQKVGIHEFQFGVAGVFEYRCTVHPEMTGTINVRPNLCENGCPIFP
ncbi:MAG: hypothetical protein EXR93_04445 [Gemmatimonadetes bacterium]|nr:hypothetical protein [Gemmatimonadota bacterium]